jgi:hypothetical protein
MDVKMLKTDKYKIKEIVSNFLKDTPYTEAKPFGSGHINDTFLVEMGGRNVRRFILQRINNNVFKDIPGLMKNIAIISEHILRKLNSGLDSQFRPECYTFLNSENGKNHYQDGLSNYWRMSPFIDDSRSFDIIDSVTKAQNGGVAYGEFQLLLSDLSPDLLCETIPNFHNIEFRLENLETSICSNEFQRVEHVEEEIRFIKNRSKEMKEILRAGRKGLIPLRITHNDTKFNNILFDNQDRVIGVIDLDTVMPGYVHYDFGDAIRTGASTASEEEKNLTLMSMDISLYEALTKGYLSKMRPVLTKTEIQYLPLSAKLATYIQVTRFLTDYLSDDIYFKISYPDNNLTRTRTQIRLLESMERQFDDMVAIVDRYAST